MGCGIIAARISIVHCVLPVALAVGREASAQPLPSIRHQRVDCLAPDHFARLFATIQPGDSVRTAKLYFRSDKYPDFYYVEMQRVEERFQAVLPKPGAETKRVIYYIEAVDAAFSAARTGEHDLEIKDPCDRRSSDAAYFTGDNPGIVVGATEAGAPAIPPGFQVAGISGFITAAGLAIGAGGGGGAATAVLVLGAAGATAGIVVAAGGENSGSTSSVFGAPGSTTTSSGSPTASTSSTTTVSGPTTTTGSTTTVGPGTTTATSTSSSSTTTTTISMPTPPTACFQFESVPRCTVRLDARCSSGTIKEYQWRFVQAPGPPSNETRLSPDPFVHDWQDDQACKSNSCGFSRSVRLTAVGPAGQSTTEFSVRVTCLGGYSVEAIAPQITFTSFLGIPPFDGSVRAHVLLEDGRLDATDNSGPTRHYVEGRLEGSTVDAYLAEDAPQGGFWRFDFSGREALRPGSLEVLEGQVISLDSRSVVFRLNGQAAERIKFRLHFTP